MKKFRGLFLFVISGVAFFGCKPDPTFPAIPALTFKEFRQPAGSDSLILVFSFTDGDGDIGVAPTDPDPNMVLAVYAPDANGVFQVLDNPITVEVDSLLYTYRIPRLTAGQKGLEGDIYLTFEHKSFLPRDTLQFNTSLLDQSHNRSNYVRTETVILTP
ncbi:hypothetical protein BH11BAC7_BH11BAC7_31150 [soil metagenome]